MKQYFFVTSYDKKGDFMGTIGTPNESDVYKKIGDFLGDNSAIISKITIQKRQAKGV